MGLLSTIGDIGKGILNAIPVVGDITETAFGRPGEQGIVGRLIPRRDSGSFNIPQLSSGGFIDPRRVQGGMPPPGTIFPDIPVVPDLGDVQQVFQGQDPFSQAPSRFFGGGGNAQTFGSQGLIPTSVVVQPQVTQRLKAPKGYVIVDMPDGSGKKAVLKPVARKLGLWKPRKKPPISVSEHNAIKKAERAKNKIKRIAEKADFKCRTKAQEARRRAKK